MTFRVGTPYPERQNKTIKKEALYSTTRRIHRTADNGYILKKDMKALVPNSIDAKAIGYIQRRLKRSLTYNEKEALVGNIEPGSGQEFKDTVDFWFDHGLSFEGRENMEDFRTNYLTRCADRREREWAKEKAQLHNTKIIDLFDVSI